MLGEVKQLREEYEAAQDEAEEKREEYHAAIRKLYMSGVTLREIADALGISHQRVHKIVGLDPIQRKKRRRVRTAITLTLSLFAAFLLVSGAAWAWASTVEYQTSPFIRMASITIKPDATSTEINQLKAALSQDASIKAVEYFEGNAFLAEYHGIRDVTTDSWLVTVKSPWDAPNIQKVYQRYGAVLNAGYHPWHYPAYGAGLLWVFGLIALVLAVRLRQHSNRL